jgi:hypothetical protein
MSEPDLIAAAVLGLVWLIAGACMIVFFMVR